MNSMTCKAVFVGSNPSTSSHYISAFHESTKSARVLNDWIKDITIENVEYINVAEYTTHNNRPLTTAEIKAALPRVNQLLKCALKDYKVVALGKTAVKALTLLKVEFYEMPHPSGLNRKLNDPKFVEEKIKGLKIYLEPNKDLD